MSPCDPSNLWSAFQYFDSTVSWMSVRFFEPNQYCGVMAGTLRTYIYINGFEIRNVRCAVRNSEHLWSKWQFPGWFRANVRAAGSDGLAQSKIRTDPNFYCTIYNKVTDLQKSNFANLPSAHLYSSFDRESRQRRRTSVKANGTSLANDKGQKQINSIKQKGYAFKKRRLVMSEWCAYKVEKPLFSLSSEIFSVHCAQKWWT